MATEIKRGKASVTGIVGTFTVILYPVAQSGTLAQTYEEEIVKDEKGFDAAWVARNLHYLADFKFKMLGDTVAHATGVTMIAPFATVTLSAFTLSDFNGSYQNISGQQIDLNNTSVADYATKFRKYDDSTQNTAALATPS